MKPYMTDFRTNQITDLLRKQLSSKKICPSHNIDHMITVMNHAIEAVKEIDIDDKLKCSIVWAALLHDADDPKLFDTKNYENARSILSEMKTSQEDTDMIIKMISLVSASKNGDSIPEGVEEWMLIPRYCDRLEAIGTIGIERCLQFARTSGLPYYLSTTPRATTVDELWKIATIDRYKGYNGKSVSAIDHFYDKLLRLGNFPIRNRYLDMVAADRTEPLVKFVLEFGKSGELL
jgi:uncharacterized protein